MGRGAREGARRVMRTAIAVFVLSVGFFLVEVGLIIYDRLTGVVL